MPIICGSGNLWTTSNFSYKPIQVQVFEASAESCDVADSEWQANSTLRTQRTLADFRYKDVRTERELTPVAGYEPHFPSYPIVWDDIEVEFADADFRKIWMYRGNLGATDEEVVRTIFMHWYIDNRKQPALAIAQLMGHA